MSEQNSFAATPAAPGGVRHSAEDLSDEICSSVEKRPGDLVRCTLVCNDNYRCNWWAPQATGTYDNPGMGGLLVTTHRVRRSRFLHATRSGKQLVIRYLPDASGRGGEDDDDGSAS